MDNSEVDYENLKAIVADLPGAQHLAYDLAREGLAEMIKAYGLEPVHLACAIMLTEAARGFIEGGVITEAETKRQRDVENFNLEAGKWFAIKHIDCLCENQGKCKACVTRCQTFIQYMDKAAQFVPDAFRVRYAVQTEAKRLEFPAPVPQVCADGHHVYDSVSNSCKWCGTVKTVQRDFIGKQDGTEKTDKD